jgi:hypothetical protein
MEELKSVGEEFQNAAVRSFGEVNKGFQAITAKVTDYYKKAFEDGSRAFEQMIGAKSVDQVFETQTWYARKAYDTYMAEMSKLGEMYVSLTRTAYQPVEEVIAKAAKTVA